MKLAFIGFRHGHIMGLYHAAVEHPRIEVVACCEEDAQTADKLRKEGTVKLTHDNYRKMLDEIECDAVAIGDYYSKRGPVAIEALERGKHIIADKPLCTSLADLERIKALSQQKKLAVGCLLDMRSGGAIRTVRRLIGEGVIGEVQTIMFSAQHPLLYGSRPMWYFEEGKHGGTINDIGIHAFDALPWITGRKFTQVVAARGWNARLPQHPFFQDCGQFMLKLDNGGGVMGDVSYLAPDGCGYTVPQYWRITFHGPGGVLECAGSRSPILLARPGDKEIQTVPSDPGQPNSVLESFLRETSGEGGELSPSTAEVLEASRISLMIQRAADEDRCQVEL
jgi:predicted dehydrogenase